MMRSGRLTSSRPSSSCSLGPSSLPIVMAVVLLAGSLIFSWSGAAAPDTDTSDTVAPETASSQAAAPEAAPPEPIDSAASASEAIAPAGADPEATTPEASAPVGFTPVSLDDLWAAKGFTVIQDSFGPTVSVLEVCNSVRGYADFEPNPTHEFKRTLLGRAWLYTEIAGVGLVPDDDGRYRIELSADVIVTDAGGRVIYDKDRAFSFEDTYDSPTGAVYAYVYVPTIFLGKGDYNVEITVNDLVSGTQTQINTLLRIV